MSMVGSSIESALRYCLGMGQNKGEIVKEFGLKPFGVKGWMSNHKMTCPWCGKTEKLGFLFVGNGVVHHLKCGHKTSLYNYLKKVGRLDLWGKEAPTVKIQPIVSIKETLVKEDVGLPIRKLPLGFKPVRPLEYLENRGFLEEHYELFNPGISNLYPKLRDDYIIFSMMHGDDLVGWLARSTMSKEWHDENLRQFKDGKGSLKLRYENSSDTDFSKIVGGLNDITENTTTIIGVEGLFDKVNVDRELGLTFQEDVKCCFFFGNHISSDQASLIKKRHPNVRNFYLMFDYGTEKESARTAGVLVDYFNIHIARVKIKDKDPGTMSREQILESLEGSVSVFEFNSGVVRGKIKND